MHRTRVSMLFVFIVVAALAAPAALAERFGDSTFPLQGSQEVPPVTTNATGSCTGSLNPLRTKYTVNCTQSITNATAAHIHGAPRGTNGSIVFFFTVGTVFSGEVTEASLKKQKDDGLNVLGIDFAEFLKRLDAGNLYVNVHSAANPGGQIRGQIPAPPVQTPFAQFGNGASGGFSMRSDIVLLNSASTGSPVTGNIKFYDADGAMLPFESLFPSGIVGTGIVVPAGDGGGSFELPPLGNVTFNSTGTGALVSGSAVAASSGDIGGYIRFGISSVGVGGVGESDVLTKAIAPVRRSGTLTSGLAIRNMEKTPITVNLSLRSNGVQVANGSATEMLNPNARVAKFIEQLFPMAATTNFNGTVLITADGTFAAIAVEFDAINGVNTTLPVNPVSP